jgi:archaetidylinositol phosphate synthase
VEHYPEEGNGNALPANSEGGKWMSTRCEGHVREGGTADRGEGGFVNALRVHKALTARLEKRLLVWMAERTPASICPDHLTALAFVSQLLAGAAYALASKDFRALWLVDLFLVFNWLGDSLDGTLARVRNQQRPRYGFYVDHIADTFGALALMAGLGCSGYLHWQIAAGMLVCFYALSIESYLAAYTIGRFHLSHGIFGPTEIRILLVAGNAIVAIHPYAHIASRSFLLFDVGGAAAIAGMALMVLAATVRHSAVLYREEALL